MNKTEGLEIGRAAARADIAQMRSLLLALIGEDDVSWRRRRQPSRDLGILRQ